MADEQKTESAQPDCERTASCEPGDHTYSWPCVHAPMAAESAQPWLPDGIGLDAHSLSIIDPEVHVVHLRLRFSDAYPRTACGAGLGHWWSGKPGEVTCPACLRTSPGQEADRG